MTVALNDIRVLREEKWDTHHVNLNLSDAVLKLCIIRFSEYTKIFFFLEN